MSQDFPTSLKLKVITPPQMLVDEDVQEVSIPSLDGYLGIFPGHRPLFVALGRGRLTYKHSQKETKLIVQGGYAEILPDRVLVFTEKGKDETEESPEQ